MGGAVGGAPSLLPVTQGGGGNAVVFGEGGLGEPGRPAGAAGERGPEAAVEFIIGERAVRIDGSGCGFGSIG